MSQSARVSSLDALVELKASFCTFTSDAREALSSLALEIQNAMGWLEEQMKHWTAAVRKCEDAVFQAKNDLARRRIMRVGDRPPDCTEQEKALRKARQRLEFAEDKVEKVRHWLRHLPEAIRDYEGPSRQLSGMIESDMPKVDALLENKILALEAYLQLGTAPASAPASVAAAPAEQTPPEKPAEKGAQA